MTLISVHPKGLESLRSVVDIKVELFSVRRAKKCDGLEAHIFLLDAISTLHPYTMIFLDR